MPKYENVVVSFSRISGRIALLLRHPIVVGLVLIFLREIVGQR